MCYWGLGCWGVGGGEPWAIYVAGTPNESDAWIPGSLRGKLPRTASGIGAISLLWKIWVFSQDLGFRITAQHSHYVVGACCATVDGTFREAPRAFGVTKSPIEEFPEEISRA